MKDLKEFPLLTRLCIRPGFDISALRSSGYWNTDTYFAGKSKYNGYGSLIGWAGHTEDGNMLSYGVEDLFNNLTRNNSFADYHASLRVTTLLGSDILLQIEDVLKKDLINYPDNCQTLDLTQNSQIEQEGVKKITFKLFPFPANSSVFIKLLGKSSTCSRNLAELAFSQSGEQIELGRNWEKHFVVKILGNKFPEEDPGNDCRNYPNEDFQSYKECDNDFLRKEVDKISPGLRPIWLSQDLSLVTLQTKLQPSSGKGFKKHYSPITYYYLQFCILKLCLEDFCLRAAFYYFIDPLVTFWTHQDTTRLLRACTMGTSYRSVQCRATPLQPTAD